MLVFLFSRQRTHHVAQGCYKPVIIPPRSVLAGVPVVTDLHWDLTTDGTQVEFMLNAHRGLSHYLQILQQRELLSNRCYANKPLILPMETHSAANLLNYPALIR